MDSVYDVIEKIRDFLREGDYTNSVTFGNLSDLDLNKLNIYPFVHIKLENATVNDTTIDFTLKIWAADIVDKYKEENFTDTLDATDEDRIYKGDNLMNVLNTQFQVVNRLFQSLTRADLRDDGYHTNPELVAEPLDSFTMELAGWTTDIVITIRNNFPIC